MTDKVSWMKIDGEYITSIKQESISPFVCFPCVVKINEEEKEAFFDYLITQLRKAKLLRIEYEV